MSQTPCFHCGEPVPPGVDLTVDIDGDARPMCCTGCRAVAQLIHESGLGRYYDFRDRLPERPEADSVGDYAAWDRDAVLDYHATAPTGDRRSIVLVLENVHCAACAWLVNHYLSGFPGVAESRLDVGDGRLRLSFDPAATPLSQLAAALDRLGYPPHLDTPDSGVERDRNERHRMLRYLMVAALGMMQVMSYALAKYIGAGSFGTAGGMDAETEEFFRLISMLVAVPVALYAGQPFYRSALRHLMQRHLGIDVPVAAALLIALFSSVLITLFGEGEVYFDSVVMFLFFLLLGRFAVMVARQRSGAVHSALARALPDQARRITDSGTETVGVVELAAGDCVLVGDGEVVPADGRVVEGRGRVDESLLSGESEPRGRVAGDAVLAGSLVAGVDRADRSGRPGHRDQRHHRTAQRSTPASPTAGPVGRSRGRHLHRRDPGLDGGRGYCLESARPVAGHPDHAGDAGRGLPLRAGAGHADRAGRRHPQPGRAGRADREPRRAGVAARHHPRHARQDRYADRAADGHRRRPCR